MTKDACSMFIEDWYRNIIYFNEFILKFDLNFVLNR